MTHLEITALVGSIMLILALGTSIALFVKLMDSRKEYSKLEREYKGYKDHNFSLLEEIKKFKDDLTKKSIQLEGLEQENKERTEYTKKINREIEVKSRKIQLLQEENDYLLENGPNILKLPLKKAVFDEVLTGERNIIDLSVKESSKKRYFDDENGLKPYHAVEVFNGYTNRSESVLFKIIGISRLIGEDIEFEKLRFDIGDRLN